MAGAARTDIEFDELADALHPLGNATRLKLLHLLTNPHYLEEIASKLGMSRQGARKHVEELETIGVVRRQPGQRDFGPVTDYRLDRARLFHITLEFSRLGSLRPAGPPTAPGETLRAGSSAAPADEDGRPCLVVVQGLDVGRQFVLRGSGPWRVGRGANADVRLEDDPFVSTLNAELRRSLSRFSILDALSTNGTFVNFAPLPRGDARPLAAGDVIGVGKTLLVLQTH